MATQEDWRSVGFRQKVISQIEEAVKRSGNPTVMMKNPSEMEQQVYIKANTRVDYLAYVARLLVYIRDIKPITAQAQQQAQAAASMGPQAGMRMQHSGAFQASKQQAGGVVQQVPLTQTQQVAKAAISLAQTSLTQQQQQAYTKSGLTQKQIIHQHLQQQQQHVQAQQQSQLLPQQQHQALMQQQGLVLGSQTQPGHHQMTQQPGHGSVGQVAPPMGVSPVQQSKLAVQAVQGRGQHVSSPATGASVPSNSMCVPTPSSVPHTSLASQVSVAPSPAPFIPSPAMVYAPSPSPQHINVAASPAAPASVPTPSTMNVQSPASVPNPGSVGAPAASPASLNPAEEQAYLDKLKELAPYVEPLKRMINKMNRELKDHSSRDLYKLKNLYDILTNPCRRLPLQALENSGNVLKKLITLKPPSAPTPPAPPTPSSSSASSAPTTTTVPSTTVAGPPLQTTVAHPTPPQAICKPLYDAVVRQAKSPMLTHTLQRTLTPLLQAMEGPPILPLPPPAKRIRLFDSHQAKCKVPHVLQGELARLCSRFKVKSGARIGVQQSCTLLHCSIGGCYKEDLNLPAVPAIEISVPQNYPLSSPECKTANYNANPFLQKVQKQLLSRLRHMPEMYSVTSLLNAWESSIRQACIAEVAVS